MAPIRTRTLLVGLAVLAALLGCATPSATGPSPAEPPATKHLIENVPFHPDDRFWCGPASLAGVLNYWGTHVSPAGIADKVYSESAKGTLPVDLEWYAQSRGFDVRSFEGELRDVRDYVDRDVPLIVFVRLDSWLQTTNHFMVVVGYRSGGIIVNSGTTRHKFVSNERFRRIWGANDRWTLAVTPG